MKQGASIPHDSNPRYLGEILFRRVEELGDKTFVKLQRGTCFEEISWREFGEKVIKGILGLHSLGLRKGERVGILSENRLEWLCADMMTLVAGWPNVVLSPKLSESMILKILSHSQARVALVEDEAGTRRLSSLQEKLPYLQHIIVMERTSLPHTLSFEGLLERGRKIERGLIQRLMEAVQSDDLATIMYTSGSTGEPKGVMRTHKNILAHITSGTGISTSKPHELFVVLLSLNHLLGRLGFHTSVANGRTTALVESIEQEVDLKTLQRLSPTSTSLVPRVMELVWEAMLDDQEIRIEWEAIETLDRKRASGGSRSFGELCRYEALKASLRAKINLFLGGRIESINCGGGPLQTRIIRFFEIIGIPLFLSYGATECGRVAIGPFGENHPGGVGKPLRNVEVRIADDGEILVRGPTVFPGYFEDPLTTREVLDVEGWFHTGDLGSVDPDGSLRVVGRKKDVFNCSDGSNIYPGQIEQLLENDPLIRQAILVGDRRLFIAALIVPDHARIAANLKKEEWALTHTEVQRVLQARIEEINSRLEHYEQVRKISILKRDFPTNVRSISAIQKIKVDRKAVEQVFATEIEEIYSPKGI